MKIIAFSGSLRKESYTTKLVKAFQKYAPEGVELTLFDVSTLPMINEDLEANLPETVTKLHVAIKSADAALFATPEYNRSYSPVIKNAIDWGSRPDDENAWDGMPVGIVGSTLYNLGTFGAQQHLRQVCMYLNMPTLQQPEFYVEKSASKFNSSGELIDHHTREKIEEFWTAFIPWIQKTRK